MFCRYGPRRAISGIVIVCMAHLGSGAESDKPIAEPGSIGRIRKVTGHFQYGVERARRKAHVDPVWIEMKRAGAVHELFEQEVHAGAREAWEPARPTVEKRRGGEIENGRNIRGQGDRKRLIRELPRE